MRGGIRRSSTWGSGGRSSRCVRGERAPLAHTTDASEVMRVHAKKDRDVGRNAPVGISSRQIASCRNILIYAAFAAFRPLLPSRPGPRHLCCKRKKHSDRGTSESGGPCSGSTKGIRWSKFDSIFSPQLLMIPAGSSRRSSSRRTLCIGKKFPSTLAKF
jgi:hypothetical protein